MNNANVHRTSKWFEVMQTGGECQTAVMKLGPGQATGEKAEAHQASTQVLLLIEGELAAEIAGKLSTVHSGDVVLIPPGVKHKFINRGAQTALTFNVYSPPEYPPGEES